MSGQNHEGSRQEDVSQNHTDLHLLLMFGQVLEVYAPDRRIFGLRTASIVLLGPPVSKKVTWLRIDVKAEHLFSFQRCLEDRGAIRRRSPIIPIFGMCHEMFHTRHHPLCIDHQMIWDLW